MDTLLLNQALEQADKIIKYPLENCGPSSDPDMQIAYLYEFKGIAKRFVACIRRFNDDSIQEMLATLNLDPESIMEAYDLKSDLIPITDYLEDLRNAQGLAPKLVSRRDRAFISYSTKNKKWGGCLKRTMESLGVSTFIAHDDLQVSEDWKNKILDELKRADVFVALLSKDFKLSDWCSQELGYIATIKEVLIIPLTIDNTNPYGFISHLQGEQLNSEDEVKTVLLDVLLRERPRIAIPNTIKKIVDVGAWRAAESLLQPLVPHFGSFTPSEAADLARAALNNSQVWDAALCRTKFLPEFLRQLGSKLPKELCEGLAAKIQP